MRLQNNKKIKVNQKGISLVEVLIATAIITTGIITLIASFTAYVRFALSKSALVQAVYLAEEGLEAMTFLRDRGWTTNIAGLSNSTTYYLTWNGSYWATTTTETYVDGSFLRKIELDPVERSVNGAVVTSGGTVDTDTRKVTVSVDYYEGTATTTKSIVTYITNLNND